MKREVYKRIADELVNLVTSNALHLARDEKRAQEIFQEALGNICTMEEHLPSGSGFDAGCSIDIKNADMNKIVIRCDFHHMNENGYYCGWSKNVATVTPSFLADFIIDVKCDFSEMDEEDRPCQFEDYIYEALYDCLKKEV